MSIDKLSKSIVGIIDIRHYLTEKYFYSGHIGYSIDPSLRCKGYGTEILQLYVILDKQSDNSKVSRLFC